MFDCDTPNHMKINSLVSLAVVLILLLLVDTEANPKARAEVNKDAILPQMTLEQIKEGKEGIRVCSCAGKAGGI